MSQLRKISASVRACPKRPQFSRGFSIIELIVAVSIFVILTTTFLINYGSFDRRVTINLLAHQIATWVHDAQVSAMSIRRAKNEEGRFPGYGLYFDTSTNNKFVFFADLNGNRLYNPYDPDGAKCGDPLEECEQEIILLHGNTLQSVCGDMPSESGQPFDCTSASSGSLLLYSNDVTHVLFARPNPFDATIFGDLNTAVDPQVPTAHSHVEVTITSPKGYRHTITIWITGQVSIR